MNTINIKLYDTLRREVATKDFVKKEISEAKNDLIKWMFGFWVTIIILLVVNFFIHK